MKPFKRSIYILGHYPYLYLLMLPPVLISWISSIMSMGIWGDISPLVSMFGSSIAALGSLASFVFIMPALGQHLMDIVTTGGQPSFYSRGLKNHWYKPICYHLLQSVGITVIGLIMAVIIIVSMIFLELLPAITFSLLTMSGILLTIIVLFVTMLYYMVFPSYFVDRLSFFQSIGLGFRYTFKRFGKLLLLSFFNLVVIIGTIYGGIALYMLKNHMSIAMLPTAMSDMSWYLILTAPLTQFVILWSYTYVFSLWREIRDEAASRP